VPCAANLPGGSEVVSAVHQKTLVRVVQEDGSSSETESVTYQKFDCFPMYEFSQKFKTFCLNLCATKFEPNLLASHPKFSIK
jgi:hypothetical protein